MDSCFLNLGMLARIKAHNGSEVLLVGFLDVPSLQPWFYTHNAGTPESAASNTLTQTQGYGML